MGKIRITHYRVRTAEENCPREPFSVAVLADMHNEVYHSDPQSLLDAIEKEEVSAVFSVGDLIVAKGKHCAGDEALKVLGGLTSRCPVYAVNGNHEVRMRNAAHFRDQYFAYDEKARALGVTMVNNRHLSLNMNGMRIGLFGLELDNGYYRRNLKEGQPEQVRRGRKPARKHYLTPADMEKLIGRPDRSEFTILLAHYPRYFPAYAKWGADLTLSGHMHGGIVRLPLIGGLVGPEPCVFPKYDHGDYKIGDRHMLVSAGLGTHTINVRINNPAELVILDFGGILAPA